MLSCWLLETLKDYRFIYVWCGACTLAGFIMCALLYRNWLRLGGDKSYQPPGFENAEAVPAATGH